LQQGQKNYNMENLFIDFNEKPSLSRGWKITLIVSGSLFILFSLIGIYLRISMHKDYFYLTFYPVWGLTYLLQAFNVFPFRNKQFIRINETEIEFKFRFLTKASKLAWNDIKKIEMKASSILVFGQDNKSNKIGLNWVSLKSVQKIKLHIREIAKTKNIQVVG